ncbi:MAG: hypothetical protein KAJ66_05845 [Candidatus Omnitrophica bacterium]|nr:hypothetical protein [Candidatus Omnitrophota bacterium]
MMALKKYLVVHLTVLLACSTVYAFDDLSSGLSGHYASMNFSVRATTVGKARVIGEKSERYYKRLLKKLRYGGMLKKKCRIYIYSNHEAYIQSLRSAGIKIPAWSGGCHLPRRHYEFGYPVVCGFIEKRLLTEVLPHELTHAIFAEFVYGKRIIEKRLSPLPLWIDEGMAVYMQERSDYKQVVKQAVSEGGYIRLKDLFILKRYPKDEAKLKYFYAQSPSLVDFLLNKYPGGKFMSLAKKSVFSAKSDEEILTSVYYGKITSISQMEKLWIKFVKERY